MNDSELKQYDLYGFRLGDLETAKLAVEEALGITLSPHESSFRGGNYYALGDIGQEHFLLQKNWDLVENEAIEGRFEDVPIVLYVNETTRPKQINALLTSSDVGFRLLDTSRL